MDKNKNNSPLTEGCLDENRDGVFPSTLTEECQTQSDGVLKKYKSLPYNHALKEKAKQLRKAGNLSEVLLWNEIKNKKLLRLDFHRQKIIGNYIVDFYCPKLNLVIEIDGSSHDFKGDYDAVRDDFLKNLGLIVIHYDDKEVRKKLDVIVSSLYRYCEELLRE